MATIKVPYQGLSAWIPDEGVPYYSDWTKRNVHIRQGKTIYTLPSSQFQGEVKEQAPDNQEGLQWLTPNYQQGTPELFKNIKPRVGEILTKTISAVNPHGVDITSSFDGVIEKSPSIQENLARAGATPEQIKSLSASALQNAGGAYTLEQLKTAGVVPQDRQSILDYASQSLSEIQKRIASEGITDASGKVLLAPITPPKPPEPIGSVVQAPTGMGATPPPLPEPQAGGVNETFITSMSADLQAKRKAVEDAYAKQIADLKAQSEASQKRIDDLTKSQEGAIDKAKELSQPFRQTLEELKNKELYITQNFEENQKLTNELSTLLTEGNDLIRQQKEKTGLEAIRNPRINQTISDVNARAGVIQAVMSARSDQIAEAQRMIDRTVSAITADRKDQLNYYSTLSDFYQNTKDKEGEKLAVLSSDKKEFLEAQIGMLKNDLKNVQDNAQKMKDLFIDPDKALKFAKAGISLNTPQGEWGKKLADQAYAEEVAKVSNERANDGYSTTPIAGVVPVQTIDSRGVVKNWYKEKEKPTFQTFERGGHNIRQVLDPMTGKVISETDLGAKTKTPEGKLSSNAQAVIENPNLLNSYTNTVKGQVIAELQQAGYDTSNLGVKPLSDTAIKEINQTETALSSLQSLRDVINENLAYIGPISGLAKYNPYSKARQVQAEVDRVKQMVGKALEGGVLRKEDEEKYKKILATITDTPNTALYKIDSLISTLQRDTENYKNLQLESGRTLDIKKGLEKKGTEIKTRDLRTKYNY